MEALEVSISLALPMRNKYDLTSSEGKDEAYKDIATIAGLVGANLDVIVPHVALYKWLGRSLGSLVNRATKPAIIAQKQAAIDLIKAGQASGVASMKIVMDQDAGIDLGTSVGGIPIKCKVGTSGHTVVEVTYK